MPLARQLSLTLLLLIRLLLLLNLLTTMTLALILIVEVIVLCSRHLLGDPSSSSPLPVLHPYFQNRGLRLLRLHT